MRSTFLIVAIVAMLAAPPAALAAPTCLDKVGDTIRCGVAGAMPVGWTLSPEQAEDRLASQPVGLSLTELVAMIYIIGAIFALIALMPPFDGWSDGDWDEQEGDREARQ